MFIDDAELVTEISFFFVQIRGWKAWEEETSSHGYEFANGMMSNDVFNCVSSSSVEFLILLTSVVYHFTLKCCYMQSHANIENLLCPQIPQDSALHMKHHL